MSKIVIDVPDGLYENLQIMKNGSIASGRILKIVREGTVLPKGHGKLIDSNVLWDAFQDLGQDFYEAFDFAEANAIIEADKAEGEG